ncbi:MAG: FG-GAP repeat protein [Alphaproteobacteria bacterium]|nr:FG-GAP repeat protein [Alphaproteobacteria bacterium]
MPLLLALTLLACDPKPGTDTGPVDRDGDGYVEGVDCDDDDPLANPAIPELCDGRDNDCDGELDEADAVDAPTWYPDADADGFGQGPGERACAGPPGAVTAGGDCDDDDPAVFPGATEVCDGVDNDCDSALDEPDAEDATAWYPDGDADGFGDPERGVVACTAPANHVAQDGDCDDDDPDTFPEAEERCDDLDNDCDAAVDEDAVDRSDWYDDPDHDGYGEGPVLATSCEAPSTGMAPVGGDCDEADPYVNPGAEERCDGVDRDCDGVVDGPNAVDAQTWYVDADADGYGEGAGTPACEAPAGQVTTDGDCDDADDAIHPAAVDLCGDGLDSDCDGWAGPACGPGGSVSLSGADAAMLGDAANIAAGDALAFPGDLNGDGYDDMLVGAVAYSGTAYTQGAGFVVYGPLTGTLHLSNADIILEGDSSTAGAGAAVAGAGDVDGDGVADLLVGAWTEDHAANDAGAAYLVRGGALAAGTFGVAAVATAALYGEDVYNYAGSALAGGDIDGDGFSDVIVGAFGNTAGGGYAGAVYVLYGPLTGEIALADADAILVGESSNDRAGAAVDAAGDTNGDGLEDVLLGAWGSDFNHQSGGAAYLLVGPLSGLLDLSSADARFTGEAVRDYAGTAVAGVGDLNDDGYDDVAISARSNDRGGVDAGAVFLVMGPANGTRDLSTADVILWGEDEYDYAGYSVSGGGDVNADGAVDLIIGAHYEDTGGTDAGAAYLVYGPVSVSGSLSGADARWFGQAAGDEAGRAVAGGGDVDADGYDDLLIGAYGFDGGATDGGAAWLLLGGPGF